MMRLRLFAALLFAGCTTTQVYIPSEARPGLQRALEGEDRFLKLSTYGMPFFGDTSKKLLSPLPSDEVRLLENTDGSAINPGPVEVTFPAGAMVRIKKVEFPSSFTMTERMLMTPRTLIWVYLDLAGTPKSAPPYVLVLRPGLKDETEFLSEIERYLTKEDPAARLSAFSDGVREAVLTKRAVVDMPSDALEMAWGYPESKRVSFDGERKQEIWTWPGNKRSAVLLDGRVTELR
jgi:hypothetical protein